MKINQKTSILFWLFKSKKTKDGLAPIYCRITIDDLREEFSTGKKIHPLKWNSKTESAVGQTEAAVSSTGNFQKSGQLFNKI